MTQTQNVDKIVNPEIEPFFKALKEQKLLLKQCKSCEKVHYYPRNLCPHCMAETDWITSSGTGEIYSWSVMRLAEEPYVVAYVRLAEGVTMLTNIITDDISALYVGMPVRAEFSLGLAPEGGVAFVPA